MKDLNELEVQDLSNMDIETKKAVVDAGVMMLLEQTQLISDLTDERKSVILSLTLAQIEKQIEELKEQEQYELCYFMNEIMWGVHRYIDLIKRSDIQ